MQRGILGKGQSNTQIINRNTKKCNLKIILNLLSNRLSANQIRPHPECLQHSTNRDDKWVTPNTLGPIKICHIEMTIITLVTSEV